MTPTFDFTTTLWRWVGEAPASWVFATLPSEVALAVRAHTHGAPKAFGSVRVTARIGGSLWQTSLFPDTRSGSYLLPIKASVRKAEKIAEGSEVEIRLTLGT